MMWSFKLRKVKWMAAIKRNPPVFPSFSTRYLQKAILWHVLQLARFSNFRIFVSKIVLLFGVYIDLGEVSSLKKVSFFLSPTAGFWDQGPTERCCGFIFVGTCTYAFDLRLKTFFQNLKYFLRFSRVVTHDNLACLRLFRKLARQVTSILSRAIFCKKSNASKAAS